MPTKRERKQRLTELESVKKERAQLQQKLATALYALRVSQEDLDRTLSPITYCEETGGERAEKEHTQADLSNLARLAASRPEFVAARLAAYQQVQHLDDVALAAQLGCSLDNLIHLRLCMVPRAEHFQEDIERIAHHVRANARALAQVLELSHPFAQE